MYAICILDFSLWICWSASSFLSHGCAEASTCFAFYRIMKDRQRYIMVRRPLIFISALQKIVRCQQYIVCMRLLFYLQQLVFCTHPLFASICPKFIIFSSSPPLIIAHSNSFFPPASSSWCIYACVFWYVRALVRPSVCMCVIFASPPRGNQQWSSDSADPLVPQHTCPWGAVRMSFEPLCECICVHVRLHHLSRKLGCVGVGMLHHLL